MAFSIRNLKIRDQILLVTLPPLFVLPCAVALFFYAYWTAIYTEHSANEAKESVIRGETFLHNNADASAALRKYIFARKADALAAYEKSMAAGQSDLITLRALESDNAAELQTVLQIQAGFDNFQKQWAFPLIARARKGERIDIAETLVDGQDRMAAIRSQVLSLQATDEKDSANAIVGSERMIRRMLVAGVGVAVVLAGVLVLFTWLVTRQIVMPLRQLIRAAEQVARGDLSPALPPAVDNEFGVLSRSFSAMTAALQRERDEIASLNRFSEHSRLQKWRFMTSCYTRSRSDSSPGKSSSSN
jgi:methyl-accepting chemotaxis protein